jgi:signal transduction histidine kinase
MFSQDYERCGDNGHGFLSMDINVRIGHDFQADLDAISEIKSVPSILSIIQRTTGMGFVAVARVNADRWIACQVLDQIDFGLKPGGELKVETTICHEIRQSHQLVAIDDVSHDDHYANHHTPLQYGFKSYISVPILLKDGGFFGTLCAIDPRPAQVNNSVIIDMFKVFAELIAVHLDAREKMLDYEHKLTEEAEQAELREQFIAVLGHDLRNPLASMLAGTRILSKTALDDRARTVVSMMLKSVDRMTNLVDNVMDFARGRLGGGVRLTPSIQPLGPTLNQVVDEISSIWPDRVLEAHFDLSQPVEVDHPRLAQLFSNLLGNALTHGSPDGKIVIWGETNDKGFELWVSNQGEPIPEDAYARLFQPFTRSDDKAGAQGLGLGLYIASKIAEAHGGALTVSSSPAETRFTLFVPRAT